MGDFDGDDTVDEAKVVAVVPADVSCERNRDMYAQMESQQLEVAFGSGQALDQQLTDCQPCLTGSLVFTATDLDGDGREELALDVGPGAAIDYVEFYRVDPGHVSPLVISEPGDRPTSSPGRRFSEADSIPVYGARFGARWRWTALANSSRSTPRTSPVPS
jgi:hypothetical protein